MERNLYEKILLSDRLHEAIRGHVAAGAAPADTLRALDAAERVIDARFGSDRAIAALAAVARDAGAPVASRATAIETLAAVEAAGHQALCQDLLTTPGLAAAAAAGLAREGDPACARALVDAYAAVAPEERPAVLAALVSRPAWAAALLDGIEQQAIPRGDVTPLVARQIAGFRDEAVRRRLDEAVVRARTDYSDKVGAIEATWRPDGSLALALDVVGMSIDSEVEVLAEELVVRLQVPGMAGLFAGRIRSGIEERLGGLLGGPQV
jgi:hypothetical protein